MKKINTAGIVFLFLCFTALPGLIKAETTMVPIYGLLLSTARGLSQSQQEIVSFAGYPQQFIKTFQEINGVERVNESWTYASLGFVESFINGRLMKERAMGVSTPGLESGELHPEEYQPGQTPAAIVAKHGAPLSSRQDSLGGGVLETYIYENITFSFLEGQLTSVVFMTSQLSTN